jgi:Fe-S cluster biosynthesis and repair protein YggX
LVARGAQAQVQRRPWQQSTGQEAGLSKLGTVSVIDHGLGITPVHSSQRLQDLFMARTVQCIKLGVEAEGLDFPPYPGELGKRIWQQVSKEAWAEWMRQQTMLVNENRLNLADQRARQYLARQMEKHFFGEGADVAQGFVPPTP